MIKLFDLLKKWDLEFKGNLIEIFTEDYNAGIPLKESLRVLIEDHMPIWLNENMNDLYTYDLLVRYDYKFNEIYKSL